MFHVATASATGSVAVGGETTLGRTQAPAPRRTPTRAARTQRVREASLDGWPRVSERSTSPSRLSRAPLTLPLPPPAASLPTCRRRRAPPATGRTEWAD